MKPPWLRFGSTILTALILFIATSQTASAWSYRVQWGDSLWKLSQRYGVSIQEIQKANGRWSTMLYAGETITIPDYTGTSDQGITAPPATPTTPVATPATPVYSLTAWEEDLLARLISAEAAGEPYEGQVAVGSVVLNRVRSSIFPNTIYGVIYERWQFEPVQNGWINQPASDSARRAARDAINGWDPTNGALYFFNWRTVSNSFLWGLPYKTTLGNHRFVG